MATKVSRALYYTPGQVECAAKGDPPATVPQPFHVTFKSSTHATLQAVSGAVSPCSPPALVRVSVFNGSDSKMVHMVLERSDTIGKLQKMYLLERPDLSGSLHLACNGKPVLEHQTLEELKLKESAMFVTYQKCIGG
ncbi:hypothetical protein AAFF_G00323350 [Aldrovandia affinis]|uniref:Ubiquitin-like domain-containing protein n=1 Tax=Aldrovandia affinis TaxID=143900 RepID=A0AAD7R723_9TELE|nr:hypothetical protein AAFF_G00323350 [Aldrovandia affinis]